jgi:glycosyltransferase 2 family protein
VSSCGKPSLALYRSAALRTLEVVPGALASTSIGHSLDVFFDAVGKFFSDLAAVHWGALVLGLAFFGLNLTIRSRAFFHSLRAAYPGVAFKWRRVWGAYVAAVGFNNVVPARGGDVIKLFLTRSSIPGSRYPTVAAAFFVESIFDATVGVLVLIFAFSQGVFPKPPNFSKLSSFDISYLAGHFRFTLFLITALAVLGLVAFALLAGRAKAFWARVRQGVAILRDRPRYLREVVSLQVVAWLSRFAAFWFFLDAFRVGGSVKNVLLVFAVNQVAGAVPLTPGGAGVQQALLVKVFAASASTSVVAAYSVGQQIAIAAFTALLGLGAVVFIFRFRSFKEVLFAGRASREAERAEERAGPAHPESAAPHEEVPAPGSQPGRLRARY